MFLCTSLSLHFLFQSWQFSANSIHYLLGFWQRLVGSVPYIRTSDPHLLDTYVPEVSGLANHDVSSYTVDHKIFLLKIFINDLFRRKLNTRNILRSVRWPIPILVAKVWRQNLDFTGKNIPIYGTWQDFCGLLLHVQSFIICIHMCIYTDHEGVCDIEAGVSGDSAEGKLGESSGWQDDGIPAARPTGYHWTVRTTCQGLYSPWSHTSSSCNISLSLSNSCEYKNTCTVLVSLFDQTASSYQELLQQPSPPPQQLLLREGTHVYLLYRTECTRWG